MKRIAPGIQLVGFLYELDDRQLGSPNDLAACQPVNCLPANPRMDYRVDIQRPSFRQGIDPSRIAAKSASTRDGFGESFPDGRIFSDPSLELHVANQFQMV